MDAQRCRERLLNRRYNVITGSEYNLASCESLLTDPDCKLDIYPKDYKDVVEQDVISILTLANVLKVYTNILF